MSRVWDSVLIVTGVREVMGSNHGRDTIVWRVCRPVGSLTRLYFLNMSSNPNSKFT